MLLSERNKLQEPTHEAQLIRHMVLQSGHSDYFNYKFF